MEDVQKQAPQPGSEKGKIRDVERFVDISGAFPGSRPKAHVLIRCFDQFSNGEMRGQQEISFDKPLLNIFAHAGWTNLYMDFGSSDDMDLRMVWTLLTDYSDTAKSVRYTDAELDSGFYYDKDGEKQLVHFPMLHVVLSPIGKEDQYQMQGFNPVSFTLGPNEIKGEPCVLQFTFTEDTFVVVNDLKPVDMSEIYHEVAEEEEAEAHGISYKKDEK